MFATNSKMVLETKFKYNGKEYIRILKKANEKESVVGEIIIKKSSQFPGFYVIEAFNCSDTNLYADAFKLLNERREVALMKLPQDKLQDFIEFSGLFEQKVSDAGAKYWTVKEPDMDVPEKPVVPYSM